jgi:DNA polymerase (family 10)
MINREIAFLLRKVAASYTIKNESKFHFQIMAYTRAADSIEHATAELKDLWDEGKLNTVPGIGPGITAYLGELFTTGEVRHFNQVTKSLPKAMFALMGIPKVGPKTAYKLAKILKLSEKNPIVELEKAVKEQRIRKIEGFGQKSEEELLKSIEAYRKGQTKENRMLLPLANAIAQEVIFYLKQNKAVIRADPLGSLRRMVSTIGDIDVAVVTNNPKGVIDHFTGYPRAGRILGKGELASSRIILKSGRQIDLLVQSEKGYGALLQHFTGSKHHNIALRELALKKGLSLSEYGIKKNGHLLEYKSEEDFYHAIGLEWIPPEIRENTGEIQAAEAGDLQNLVTIHDIMGDVQIHSNFPIEPSHDLGSSSMEEIIATAKALDYEYVGFSEHNPSISRHTDQQIIDILKRRNEKINKLKESNKDIRIVNLLEVDILVNGEMSLKDEALKLLDGVIASIHTSMDQPREQMTMRIIKALKNPFVRFIAHPTGRLLNQREGYEVDWDEIFRLCKQYDKALEINAYPDRLDLPDFLVREAVNKGVKLIINTDSHDASQMELMRYGVAVARRGWAESRDIINTMGYNDFIKWIHIRKP